MKYKKTMLIVCLFILLIGIVGSYFLYNNYKITQDKLLVKQIEQGLESQYGELNNGENMPSTWRPNTEISNVNPRNKWFNNSDDEIAYLTHTGDIGGVGNLTFNFTTGGYGFFSYLGSLPSRITKGWFKDLDVSQNATVSQNLTVGNKLEVNNVNVGDWLHNESENTFYTISSQSGTTSPNIYRDTLLINGAGISTTSILGDTLTITSTETDPFFINENVSIWNSINSKIASSNESNLNVNSSSLLDTYDSSYFAPLNTSFDGTEWKWKGGFVSGGTSIIGGDIYTQQLFVVNITGLSVTTINMNGSIIPGINDVFDIGSSSLQWNDLYLGTGDLYLGGTGQKKWWYNQTNSIYYYNQTQSIYYYNQTATHFFYNMTASENQTIYNSTYNSWSYNQSLWIISNFSGYWGNQSIYNSTYAQWAYNQSTHPLLVISDNNASWLSTYNNSYQGLISNASYLSTFNATYDIWAYNQTLASGWNKLGTNVILGTSTDNVEIGTNAIMTNFNKVELIIGNDSDTDSTRCVRLDNQGQNYGVNICSLFNSAKAFYIEEDNNAVVGSNINILKSSSDAAVITIGQGDEFKVHGDTNWVNVTSSSFVVDVKTFYVDWGTDKIGIGDISPSHLLTIANSAVALNVSNLLFANSSSVGIGTNIPLSNLHLLSSLSNELRIETTGSGLTSSINLKTPEVNWTIANTLADQFVIYYNQTITQPRFLLDDATGYIGIGGVTSPAQMLDINGNIKTNLTGTGVDYVCVNANGVLFRQDGICT